MKNLSAKFWLALIIGLGFLFRIWQVGTLPSILNRDEAALAYNAYLLMETGRDEWGKVWPLALQSFGDYKLPGYAWAIMPFFKVLGLTDLAVRLPSVLAGTALIGLSFFLARQFGLKNRPSLLVAGLVACSPVLIFYSRMAWEANLALTYLTAGLILIFKIKQVGHWWHYQLLALLMLLAVFTYNTPLLLLPALMIFAWFIFDRKTRRRFWLTTGLLAVVFFVGLASLLPTLSQKSGITIFTDETVWSQWTAFRATLMSPWDQLIGNRYVYDLSLVLKNIANSFSPDFLVFRGGQHPWHNLPSSGHLTLLVYVLGWLGIFDLLRTIWQARKKLAKVKIELGLFFLLLATLAPAVITVDAPHATRSLLFFLLWQILAVKGVILMSQCFKVDRRRWVWPIVWLGVLADLGLFGYRLFGLYPGQQVRFQPGFDQVIQQVEQQHSLQEVAIVDPAGYQYILLAWYLKLPPKIYFDTTVRQQPDLIGFRYGERVTHYHFIAQPADRAQNELVLVQWSDQESAWQVEEDL